MNLKNTSSGKKCKGYQILIGRTKNTIQGYLDYKNLSNTKKVKFHIKSGLATFSELNIQESILDKIAQYISLEVNVSTSEINDGGFFDCASFVHHVHGIEYIGNIMDMSQYNIFEYTEIERKIGDIVYTGLEEDVNDISTNNTSIHFMIYLGNDLFLSKFGSTGRLVVTELIEIKKIYPFDFTKILRLKLINGNTKK